MMTASVTAVSMIVGSALTAAVLMLTVLVISIRRNVRQDSDRCRRVERQMCEEAERRRQVEAVTLQALEVMTLHMEPQRPAAHTHTHPHTRRRHLAAVPRTDPPC